MDTVVGIVLETGKSVVTIALFTLMPIMVLMMAVMRLLDKKGVLAWIARYMSPLLFIFGLPGIGVFVMLQMTLVSFAAPMTTLTMIDGDPLIDERRIAATCALILAMSQANVVFPLVSVGLRLGITLLSSLAAGLTAAALTYYLFGRKLRRIDSGHERDVVRREKDRTPILTLITDGGLEGLIMVAKTVPMLLIALLAVNILDYAGVIELLQRGAGPLLSRVGIPGAAVLPIATKFLAGGTAMMGVVIDLIEKGVMNPDELNRIAGFIVHPFDLVGIALYASTGPRVAAVIRRALPGAAAAIILRGVFHLLLF